jgi:hypothetical protein
MPVADLINGALQWLNGMRHKHATRPVTYIRGSASITIQATVGRSVFQVLSSEGAVGTVERRDYIVRAVDLVFGGAVTLPQVGDRVRETVGGQVQEYEVVETGQEPHYRKVDPDGTALRVHTALVKVAAA